MTKLKIKTSIVYKHLVNSKKKIIVEQGGTRSGKTYNILLWIIFEYCTNNNNKIITICRKSFPSLRATVMRDFITILQEHKCYSETFHNKSNSELLWGCCISSNIKGIKLLNKLFCLSKDIKQMYLYGAVAQLGERLLCKQEVVGSIPSSSTI